jgi:hypothetical protein
LACLARIRYGRTITNFHCEAFEYGHYSIITSLDMFCSKIMEGS